MDQRYSKKRRHTVPIAHINQQISGTSHFQNDLGLDSLDTVEVVMAIEEEFSIEIPDKEADVIHSGMLDENLLKSSFVANRSQSIKQSRTSLRSQMLTKRNRCLRCRWARVKNPLCTFSSSMGIRRNCTIILQY